MLSFFVASPSAAVAKDGRDDVRVFATCGRGATAALRLKTVDGGIELRFKLDHSRPGAAWRVALVHERRVAWKGTVRTIRPKRSFELKRTLPDFPGTDTITARAWGPQGLTCRASGTLARSTSS